MPTPTNLPELPPGPDLDNLRGSIDATASAPKPLLVAVLVILAIALGLLLWLLAKRRQNKEPKEIHPCDAAEQTLQRAREIDLDDAFAAQASLAVRTCLGAIIPQPMSATTAELERELVAIPDVEARRIHQLLQSCDSVKFSGSKLSQEERTMIFESAEKIIAERRRATAASEKKTVQT
jgi:hypothetical protein